MMSPVAPLRDGGSLPWKRWITRLPIASPGPPVSFRSWPICFDRLSPAPRRPRYHRQHEQAGNPYDNAKAESFMKTLKTEEVDGRRFKNIEHARRFISVFIDTIYNTERLHSQQTIASRTAFHAEPATGDTVFRFRR